jgi:hypothetical protein
MLPCTTKKELKREVAVLVLTDRISCHCEALKLVIRRHFTFSIGYGVQIQNLNDSITFWASPTLLKT